MAEKTELRS